MNNPADRSEMIDPERLIQATDAVIEALQELERNNKATIYPPDLMGAPDQPAVLCNYTRYEVEEATHFLTRMGIIEIANP